MNLIIEYDKIIKKQKGRSIMAENILKFKDWNDLEGTELLQLLEQSVDLDEELYELMMKKVPYLLKQTKMVHKQTYKTTKISMKLSKQTKKYYLKVSKSILKLIKNSEVSNELKVELIELLKEITLKIEKCDERDKHFLTQQHVKTFGYSTLALAGLVAIYGVKAIKKD